MFYLKSSTVNIYKLKIWSQYRSNTPELFWHAYVYWLVLYWFVNSVNEPMKEKNSKEYCWNLLQTEVQYATALTSHHSLLLARKSWVQVGTLRLGFLRSFMLFISTCRHALGYYLNLAHNCFLPLPLPLML